MKKEIEFEPIAQPGRGHIALGIRPPGTWFDSKEYKVFVGGCGRGGHRTLASAKKALLQIAISECDERIARAEADLAHYQRERAKLATYGLRKPKTKRGVG